MSESMANAKKNVLDRIYLLLAVTAVLVVMAVNAPLQAGETEAADTFEGDGMEMPLDGSSLEAFEASMAEVKKHSKESTYISLENAIEYLLVYDLEVKRSKEKLVAKLNGLTGYEVLSRVGWRKPAPGKSKAEKGSADAQIIDS
jgi:hypothetical protein